MSPSERSHPSGAKVKRRADRATLATYHEAKLADLLEHVRAGFVAYDSGEINAFDLDEIIHHYKRSTQELWKFCSVSGADVERAVRALEFRKAEGEELDWWELGAPRRR
ncbi:MAG TPA: hypothetical protein VM674_03475 [Candidatus Acidoferrum sp.]|nr:hypothetical protein [Candidatus Acidoferrum sp.]